MSAAEDVRRDGTVRAEARTCVVTGATSGIGLEIARILAENGERVIGVGRDPKRCSDARAAIEGSAAPGAAVDFVVADLSTLAGVRSAAEGVRALTGRVDVLVNNAGTFTFRRQETPDGLETQLAVNWLAGFALTGLLLGLLRAAGAARVVTVSSGSHFSGRMHWGDLQLSRWYNGLAAYDQSKLATVLFTRELARRLGPGAKLCAYAVDPGLVSTGIGAKGAGLLVRLVWTLRSRRGISPRRAAESVVWCCRDAGASGRSGLYWKDRAAVAASARAGSDGDARRLWEVGEGLAGLRYP